MSAYDGSVVIGIDGDESGLKKKLEGLGGVAQKGLAVVTGAIAAAGAALAGVGTFAVKVGSDFEASMSQVGATMGMTVEEIRNGSEDFEMLREAAKAAGAATQFSATQAGEALNYLALAGYDAEKSCEALPVVLDLAAAGGMDLAYASDLVTDSMSALGLQTSQLSEFTDQMAVAAQKSNTSIAQLGEAILTVGGTAKNLAGGTVELSTALGILADNGIKGSEGGTSLRNIILALTPTTDAAVAAFKKLNVETYDADGNLRPIAETFRDLNAAMDPLTQKEKTELLNDIFNRVDLKAAAALMGATATSIDNLEAALTAAEVPIGNIGMSMQELADSFDASEESFTFQRRAVEEWGMTADEASLLYNGLLAVVDDSGDRFDELSGHIANSEGATKQMAAVMIDNLQGMRTILTSALEGLGIEIYEKIQGPLKGMVESATETVGELSEVVKEEGLNGLVNALGEIAAQALTSIAEMTPMAIDAAVQMVQSFLGGLRSSLPQIVQSGVSIVSSLVNGILALLPEILLLGAELLVMLAGGIGSALPELIPAAVDAVVVFASGLVDMLPTLVESAAELVKGLAQGIVNALPTLIQQAPVIIAELAGAVIGNLPVIITTGIEVLMALITGLIGAIPELIAAIPSIIIAFIAGIAQNLDKIILAAPQIILALITGLINAIPELVMAIPTIIISIVEVFTSYDWAQIGKDIISGLISGIKGMAKNAADAAKNVGSQIVDGVKGFFKIKSPSRLFRDEIGKQLVLGIAEGLAQNAKAATKEAKDLSKNILNAAVSWVGDKQFYNQLAAADEVIFWEEMKKTASLAADELAEIDKKIYTARANASKESFDYSKDWIEKEKFYSRLSAAEEVAAWERVTQKEGLLAVEREQAERNLYTAKQNLQTEHQKLLEAYEKDIESRTSALKSFAGLFDEITVKGDVTGKDLLSNLQGQIDAFAGWQEDMETLIGRGISDELLAELRSLGPKSAEQIQALTQLTETELQEYVDLFALKSQMAAEQAQLEIGEFAMPVVLEYDGTLLETDTQAVIDAAADAVDSIVQGMAEQAPEINTIAEQIAQSVIVTVEGFERQFEDVGAMITKGIQRGIESGRSGLINGIVSMLQAAVAAAKSAMDIRSPSRLWADEVGSQMAAGTETGFADRMKAAGAVIQKALTAETSRMSAQINIDAVKSVSAESSAGQVERYYSSSVIERTPKIEFNGDAAGFARWLYPHIKVEEQRLGDSLVRG